MIFIKLKFLSKYLIFLFKLFFLILIVRIFTFSVNGACASNEVCLGSKTISLMYSCDPIGGACQVSDWYNLTYSCDSNCNYTNNPFIQYDCGNANYPACIPIQSYVNLDCCSGSGGGYTYNRCPSGTNLSCGSSTEAATQNKTSCTYKATCNQYFWPSLITVPAPCNANPVSATCNWNCSCCATGTTRSCTTGTTYTKDITIDLTNGDTAANEAAKVTCNTHDHIFISNTLIRSYTNAGGDRLQDWRLNCQRNTCSCVPIATATPTTPPSPTPTAYIRVRTYNPQLTPVVYPNYLYKAACVSSPCAFVSSTSNVSAVDFAGAEVNRGGGIDKGTDYTLLGVTPYENGAFSNTGTYSPDCNGATGNRSCYTWSTRLYTGSRLLRFIVVTNTPYPTPTTGPAPWIRLKDTSFYSNSGLTSSIPSSPTAYDSDDDYSTNFINYNGGLVAASSISLGAGDPNSHNWSYQGTNTQGSFTPLSFSQYVRARKNYEEISSISEIDSNGIYVVKDTATPLTLDNSVLSQTTASKIVLLVDGEVNIDEPRFNFGANCVDTSSSKSIVIMSTTGSISFSNNTQCAAGIFISDAISTGNPADQGLKIKGNLIAQSIFDNNRAWSNLDVPSVFIVFDSNQYLNLLPYLAIVNYEWNQTQ